MERFNFYHGAIALVLDLVKAFERVSLPVVWVWATQFKFSQEDLACAMRLFRTPVEGAARNMCGGATPDITAILFESKRRCLLLRIVLQDALNEVTNIFPPLKMRVIVDDITTFMNGRNKELVEMAEKVVKKLKREREDKGLKPSITEGDNDFLQISGGEVSGIGDKCWNGDSGLENGNPTGGERRSRREERSAM